MRSICRRLCVLRSRGRLAEAGRIEETELAAAMAQAREGPEGGLGADARLSAVLAEEGERVAAAVAFAEILAPLLTERLAARAPERGRAAADPARRAPAPSAGDRGIADFIEEMLAQDRGGPR